MHTTRDAILSLHYNSGSCMLITQYVIPFTNSIIAFNNVYHVVKFLFASDNCIIYQTSDTQETVKYVDSTAEDRNFVLLISFIFVFYLLRTIKPIKMQTTFLHIKQSLLRVCWIKGRNIVRRSLSIYSFFPLHVFNLSTW